MIWLFDFCRTLRTYLISLILKKTIKNINFYSFQEVLFGPLSRTKQGRVRVQTHLGGLLPPQGHLGRHDPLPLHHQQAVRALTVPPAAEPLVTLQTRDHPVVPAPGALRGPAQLPLVPGAQASGTPRRLLAPGPVPVPVRSERSGTGPAAGVFRTRVFGLQSLHVDLKVAAGAVRHVCGLRLVRLGSVRFLQVRLQVLLLIKGKSYWSLFVCSEIKFK